MEIKYIHVHHAGGLAASLFYFIFYYLLYSVPFSCKSSSQRSRTLMGPQDKMAARNDDSMQISGANFLPPPTPFLRSFYTLFLSLNLSRLLNIPPHFPSVPFSGCHCRRCNRGHQEASLLAAFLPISRGLATLFLWGVRPSSSFHSFSSFAYCRRIKNTR